MTWLCSEEKVGKSISLLIDVFEWAHHTLTHTHTHTHTLCGAPAKSRGDCFLSVEPRPGSKEERVQNTHTYIRVVYLCPDLVILLYIFFILP